MPEDIEGPLSVMIFEALGKDMASPEIALGLAELLIKEIHGEEHFKTQLPLKVTDGGDRWIVKGSRRGEDYPVEPGVLHQDEVTIEIRKSNCEVLKLIQKAW